VTTGHQVRSYVPLVSTDHPTDRTDTAGRAGAATYEIRVGGRLGAHWSTWFEGFVLEVGDDATTVLRGEVADQAALHGVLHKLRDIGVPLISLGPTAGPTTGSPTPTEPPRHTPGAPT
jgi:hypothetical protein